MTNNLSTIRQVVGRELEAHREVIGEEVPSAHIAYTLLILDAYGLLNHDGIHGFTAEEWMERVKEIRRKVLDELTAAPTGDQRALQQFLSTPDSR